MMNLFSTHPPLEERIARLRGGRPALPIEERDEDMGKKAAEAMWRHLSGK